MMRGGLMPLSDLALLANTSGRGVWLCPVGIPAIPV
jgi:hypothetical protein